MKPLNDSKTGCVTTTSNCVIWQGPDIECINLCKGDTVSDVVAKLATELCQILDVLDISSYDLSCFNLTSCQPSDFEQLIQFLIGRVCKLEQCTGCIPDCNGDSEQPAQPGNAAAGCPDCLVPIADCFYYQNELGDTITTMQLIDYVRAIGNRICGNVQTIGGQSRTLQNHEVRITTLEDTQAPEYVPPTIIPACVLPQVPVQMDEMLSALEIQFCELRSATGYPQDIYQKIALQCAALNEEETLNGSGATMAALPGWSSVVNNMAQAMGNMWLTICDMRQAIKTIQLNCCPTGCDGIELLLTATVNGDILTVYVTGTIPAEFTQCNGITQVKVTDSNGNSASFPMDLIGYLNNVLGFVINLNGTVINPSLNLHVEITPCLTDPATQTTCQSYLSYNIVSQAPCPQVIYTAADTSISYNFLAGAGDYTYNVQLWDASGSTMIANQIQAVSGPVNVVGQFISLSPGTVYKVRVTVQPTSCPECEPVACPFQNVTTNPPSCPAPEAVSAMIV